MTSEQIANNNLAKVTGIWRSHTLWAVVVVLAALLFYFLTIRPGHNWGDDFSQYIIHARNIVNGVPYKATGHILNKIYSIAPETYPPVFPLLLAPLYYFFGLQVDVLKTVGIVCFGGFLLLYFFLFRKEIQPNLLIFSMVLMALNPYFWDFKDSILSEFPFMFFIFLTLLLILGANRAGSSFSKKLLRYTLIGICIYLVAGTRSIGIVLLPCFVLNEVLRRDKVKKWYLLTGVSVAVTGTLLFIQKLYLNSQGEGYLFQLQRYFNWSDIVKNFYNYGTDFQVFWSGNEESMLGEAVYYFLFAFALGGFLIRLFRKISLIEIFVVSYLAAVFLWPMYQAMRFLMPLVPFFLFYILIFLQEFWLLQFRKSLQVIGLTVLSVLMCSYAFFHSGYDFNQNLGYIESPASEEFFTFVRYTPPDARFVFEKPRALTLFTGHKAGVAPYCTENLKDLADFYKEANISYLAVFSWDVSCARDFVNQYPEEAVKVFENNLFQVYKISIKE